MNYQALFEALGSHATAIGYHPTVADRLHQTLRHEGFPLAIISYPQQTASDGVREVEKEFSVELKLLRENEVTPSARAEALSLLMEDAERLAAALAEESAVREVAVMELSPVERMLTIVGEVAVALKLRIKTVECC
ncbi:MAG: hypothetical protein J6U53_01040 [Tidjanibacter sp.]|nr:hypothetical protein [Tidjanibacter sp.]